MAESIDQVVKEVQEEFSKVLGNLSDYELSIIEKSIRLPFLKVFTSTATMTDAIQSYASSISELNYLSTKISSSRYEINVKYRSSFEKNYTILTRSGRPSRLAIESEIHYLNPDLSEMRNKIDSIDIILKWIESQIEVLNISIKNYESLKYKS